LAAWLPTGQAEKRNLLKNTIYESYAKISSFNLAPARRQGVLVAGPWALYLTALNGVDWCNIAAGGRVGVESARAE
jgi:hypothetical protein